MLRRAELMGYSTRMRRSQLAILAAVVALALGSAASAPQPRKLALLVGLSKYSHGGPDNAQPWWELHGRADVDRLQQVLIENLGFVAADIRVLRDAEATKAGILEAFRTHLIGQARPGDQVLFHFSGHGQQLPDDDGDEQDGLDESLVPYDAYDRSVEVGVRTNIRDDEVGKLLNELQAKMNVHGKLEGAITVTLDSCFSGTATRGGLVERGRGWDPQTDGSHPSGSTHGREDGDSGFFQKGEAVQMGYVLLTASRSNQSAREMGGMGIFSHALVKTLAALRPGLGTTGQWLYNRIAAEMVQEDPDQEPQLEGAADAPLFSGDKIVSPPPRNALQVLQKSAGTFMLQGGEIHGVTTGSIYRLYPLTPGDQSQPITEAEVVKVFPFESRLTMRQSQQAALSDLKGALAIEKEHFYGDQKLKLYLSGMQSLPELVARIRQLSVVGTKEATPAKHDLALKYDLHKLKLYRAGTIAPLKELDVNKDAVAELESVLKREWIWKYLSGLSNHDQQGQVDVTLVIVGKVTDATRTCTSTLVSGSSFENGFRSGDCFKIEIRNRSSGPRYVTVLELAEDGDISLFYPQGQDLGNNRLEVTKPDRPPRQSYETYVVKGMPGSRSLLKVFVTEQPVSFAAVLPGLQTTRGTQAASALSGSYRPLLRFFQQMTAGQRGVGPAADQINATGWSTSEAWLRVIK